MIAVPCHCTNRVALILAALLACLSGSCRSVHFYAQAAHGQYEILRKAKPIPEVTAADSSTPADVKQRLELVGELRAFAAEKLGLPAERQYDRYTDLGRPYVVWVVFAAPEFSTEGKTWTYPFLGKLKYRGWFTERAAQRETDDLKRAGYDVTMGGTEAYSTLGWLRDPVLNTFLHRSDADLAELIFHELTHQALFLRGDTDFNEALATAVGEYGARLWLQSKGRMRDLTVYDRQLRLKRRIIREILRTRDSLTQLYAVTEHLPAEERRKLKTAAFTALRQKAAALRAEEGVVLARQPPLLNNAALNSVAAYYKLLPGFEKHLQHAGSAPAFLAAMERLKSLSKSERRAVLNRAPDSRQKIARQGT